MMSGRSLESFVYYAGGTAFVIAASQLGYLLSVGEWTTPGIAEVPIGDAEIFEELLNEANIQFSKRKGLYY